MKFNLGDYIKKKNLFNFVIFVFSKTYFSIVVMSFNTIVT